MQQSILLHLYFNYIIYNFVISLLINLFIVIIEGKRTKANREYQVVNGENKLGVIFF